MVGKELFDHRNDYSETKNVINDLAFEKELPRLEKLLHAYSEK